MAIVLMLGEVEKDNRPKMEDLKVGDFVHQSFNGDSYSYVILEIINRRGRKGFRIASVPDMIGEERTFKRPEPFSEERILETLMTGLEIIEKKKNDQNWMGSELTILSPHHRAKSKAWMDGRGRSAAWGYYPGFCYSYNPHL